MAKPISLSQARKARDRVKKRTQADENAAKFGLTKAEKNRSRAHAEKAARDLDAHKRET